jgi:hypothetical protein
MLARITPGPSALTSGSSNATCHTIHQVVVDLIDPMKSTETGRWLAGELRAPT